MNKIIVSFQFQVLFKIVSIIESVLLNIFLNDIFLEVFDLLRLIIVDTRFNFES